MTEEITTVTDLTAELRGKLIDELCEWEPFRVAGVEDTMRTVPRHVFLPGISLQEAYSHTNIVTHRDAEGVALSSASAAGTVAGMLQQLEMRPGHRVLEIGAGTGYNAALLAYLTGPEGEVTTVDIDAEVVEGARRNLNAAGHEGVRVVCGDGEFGCADHAPYDRIVVTGGAWDLPPAWSDQLAPGGRLVVPLRMRGLTRSIAFERVDGYWRSRSIRECGFIPLRGAGGVAECNIFLDGERPVTLRIDDGYPADARALRRALEHPPALFWTGATTGALEHLDFWLATMEGFCRLLVHSDAIDRGLVAPVYNWGSMGVFDQGTFTYLTRRSTNDPNGTTQPLFELGVCAYGPGGEMLASRVADLVRTWDRDRRSITELWIEAHPADTDNAPSGQLVIPKRHTQVIVRTTLRKDDHK